MLACNPTSHGRIRSNSRRCLSSGRSTAYPLWLTPLPCCPPPAVNISLMMIAGFFVNGPYALITTAVSADLGTHESLAGTS